VPFDSLGFFIFFIFFLIFLKIFIFSRSPAGDMSISCLFT